MSIKKLLISRFVSKHAGFRQTYRVSILPADAQAIMIDALGTPMLSSSLIGHIDKANYEDDLLVELGSPGIGTFMQLRRQENVLLPRLRIGLYDDMEDDLGVPWLLPLSAYRRAD